jgi:hypothetical protein
MFAQLVFRDSSLQIKNPAEARGWASTHLGLSPEFFGRNAENRTVPANGLSVHPSGPDSSGARGVTVESFGEEATRTLMAGLIPAQTRFSQEYPHGECTHHFGLAGMRVVRQLHSYQVFDFVLTGRRSDPTIDRQWKANPDRQWLTDLAQKLFLKQLDARLAIIGQDMPEDALFGDFEATVCRPVSAGGVWKFAVTLAFRANVIFDGPWNVGKLANKGCGRVRSAPWSTPPVAEAA